ncbi:hypothetical protein DVH05_000686 [Phytophthora capsici]|nr:hypothetical protein DVH05_000686 [Phytophthora capsici]
MSSDTHKYGYGSKGTSVVLYKNSEIRRFQYFSYADWTDGLYATPTLVGSRPGALSATAWVSDVKGTPKKKTKGILDTVDEIKVGIQHFDGIHLLEDPKAMVVSFASDKGVNEHQKSSIEPRILEHLADYEFRTTVVEVTEARLQEDIKRRAGTLMNDHVPDVARLFRDSLKMDIKVADIHARVVKYFMDFDQGVDEHGLMAWVGEGP